MRVRPGETKDLEMLAQIAAQTDFSGWSKASIEEELNRATARVLVAEMERIVGFSVAGFLVVGFLVVWIVEGEAELQLMVVDRAHRRSGVGRALMAALEEKARRAGARVIHLEVGASNEGALALYRSSGFSKAGDRPAYYRSGDAAVLMSKVLG